MTVNKKDPVLAVLQLSGGNELSELCLETADHPHLAVALAQNFRGQVNDSS